MEKMNFVRDGGVSKLPPGFRFQPTDDEIVFQYLSRKIFSHPLPAQIIPEIDVFTFPPWQLPGDHESDQEKYFFSKKGDACNETASGFWKAVGSVKRIICSERMPIVGMRKSLVFYKLGGNKNSCGAVRTDWVMHQFCIALAPNPHSNLPQFNNSKACLIRIGEWSLCRIFLKRSRTITQVDDDGYMSDTDSSASSSSPHSDSSIFSEVSSS
ncbi:hypothetical protein ACS0TY_030399 [Phlomoides rotata]